MNDNDILIYMISLCDNFNPLNVRIKSRCWQDFLLSRKSQTFDKWIDRPREVWLHLFLESYTFAHLEYLHVTCVLRWGAYIDQKKFDLHNPHHFTLVFNITKWILGNNSQELEFVSSLCIYCCNIKIQEARGPHRSP